MINDPKNLEILIVEDNPGDFVIIQDYLQEQHLNPDIQHAKTFEEAVAFLSGNIDFDIILLDLTLPGKSGHELLTDILNICNEVPVIVLTGFTDMEFSIQSISLGASDYLLKNELTPTYLHKSILYSLERKKRIHQLKESDKRYSELFRLNPHPTWISDIKTFRFIQVNKAAVDLYGYSEEEFQKMTLFDIRPKEEVPLLKKWLDSHIDEESYINGKFTHYTKSGKRIDTEVQSIFISINDKKYRLAIITDVTEKNRMEDQITRAIIKTQENERYEIGAELHDNICQILASTLITLGVLRKSINPCGMDLFKQCKEYITLATQEIRNLSHRLAPAFFNDSTLEEAFGVLLNNSNLENKYNITLYFDEAVEKAHISRDLQLNLYRILQEQLRNILKYAHCKKIEVDLIVKNKKLKMRIADDGVGFDVNAARNGIGLSNLKRRVELFYGKLHIFSSPGNGCELVIDIPLKHDNLNEDEAKFKQST